MMIRSISPLLIATALLMPCSAQESPPSNQRPAKVTEKPKVSVPEDLLDDEHVQEEFGVSDLTTPSIKKIFEDLESLGTLPYDALKRELPNKVSSDRTLIALNLGVLIGDGFLSIQSEKISDLEGIGRAILKHAKVLGAGSRVSEQMKGILEDSALSDWKELKLSLAKTQDNVKREMVLLRDIDMVHLISLGGWLRGLQIASTTSLDPFSADKAKVLARFDITEYYAHVLEELSPTHQKLPHLITLRQGLAEISQIVNLPEGKPLSKEEVKRLLAKAEEMLAAIVKDAK